MWSGRTGADRREDTKIPYFTKNDGMILLSDPVWLQGGFSTLVGLFYWVIWNINIGKMVRMVCRLCQAAGT